MPLIIGTSANISVFDFAISYNLNTQTATLTNQSTYIGGGAAATLGIDFKLTSPSGIVWHENTATGVNSDITPALPNAAFTPTEDMVSFLGSVEYGNWVALGTITDGDGTKYTLSKTLNICKPAQCDAVKNTSNSCAEITFVANCLTNIIQYNDVTPYVYKGVSYSTITYSVSVTYPASSGKAPISNANIAYFQDSPTFNGFYQLVISNTATYDFSDSQSVTVVYKLNKDYEISCTVGLCDLKCSLANYIDEYIDTKNNNASSQKARTMGENMLLLLAYIQEAEIALSCGDDISDLIAKIEAITGKPCDCCGSANNSRGVITDQNIIIEEGCGDVVVQTVTVGNTTTITISDTSYDITTDSAGVTITKTTIGCVETVSIDICLENLQLCNSVVVVSDGNGGSTVVSGGGTILDIVDAVNIGIDALDSRDTSLEAQVAALIAPLSWTNIANGSYSNGWVNNTQGRYAKNSFGQVEMQGLLENAAAVNGTVLTLPVGYRPSQTLSFLSNGTNFGLSVSTAGVVSYEGSGGFQQITLTLIRFNVA